MLIKLSPLWHVLFVPPSTGNHNGTCPHPQKCCRLTNLEPCPSIGSGFSLEKKEAKILCTCPARPMNTPGQLFMHRRDAPVSLCRVWCRQLKKSQVEGPHV